MKKVTIIMENEKVMSGELYPDVGFSFSITIVTFFIVSPFYL